MYINRIDGVRVSLLASNALDCGFEFRLGKIGICCLSGKLAV